MTALSYREYALDLHRRIDKLRVSEDHFASIEIAICRNAHCYKSEEVTGRNGSRRFLTGPLNSFEGLAEEDGTATKKEIEAFFALPEIYAYTDLALENERSPLTKSHWDGTVALIEVRYQTVRTTWHQRMLFIGFTDPIHADFTVGLYTDLFIDGPREGTQLFEWRAAATQPPELDRIKSSAPREMAC
ncbi:hypothetical protein [Endobacterium cereale]|uniref:hypothetical protein n=1 Tax=Endobacterium cereale TaxID=2663029 RepID=UPI002B4A6A3C|nr:hypothetical protein [Endobacterium cereale]MEB2848043.1 hypothetical protein [Endobacterium cereale]